MKTITLYRDDFKKSLEVDFFEDLLQQLKVPENDWNLIDEVEITIDEFKLISG